MSRLSRAAGSVALLIAAMLARSSLAALAADTAAAGLHLGFDTIDALVRGNGWPVPGVSGQALQLDGLAGNYGGAWQDQKVEFAQFPGAILMTTNCIQEPQDSYSDKIFTAGHVGWPGIKHYQRRFHTGH